MWIFHPLRNFEEKKYPRDQSLLPSYMTSSEWHQQKSSSGQQVNQRLDHSLSQVGSHVLYNFVQVWLEQSECSGPTEETFSTCFLYKPLWSLLSNSNWKLNNSLLACFPRDSSSINRRGHWWRKERVWNTKHLSLSKQKAINLFNISFDNHKANSIIFHYIYHLYFSLRTFVWVCICKRIDLFETLDRNNILHYSCLRR